MLFPFVPQLQISLRRRISGLHKDVCSTFVAVTSIFGSSAKVPVGINMIDVVASENISLLTYSFFSFALVSTILKLLELVRLKEKKRMWTSKANARICI